MQYEDLIVEVHGKVALIRLNRPKALNALNDRMMNELGDALYKFDADASIGCIVLTGSEKAFAAGADIAAMADYTYEDTYRDNYITRNWEHILRVRKPVVGAVAGYALGGGCELAMMCDFLIAATTPIRPAGNQGWRTPGAGGTHVCRAPSARRRPWTCCLTHAPSTRPKPSASACSARRACGQADRRGAGRSQTSPRCRPRWR